MTLSLLTSSTTALLTCTSGAAHPLSHRAALQAEDPRAAAAGGAQLVFQDSDRQGMFVFKGRQVGEGEGEGSRNGVL